MSQADVQNQNKLQTWVVGIALVTLLLTVGAGIGKTFFSQPKERDLKIDLLTENLKNLKDIIENNSVLNNNKTESMRLSIEKQSLKLDTFMVKSEARLETNSKKIDDNATKINDIDKEIREIREKVIKIESR